MPPINQCETHRQNETSGTEHCMVISMLFLDEALAWIMYITQAGRASEILASILSLLTDEVIDEN